jgi:TetR/AcrR family transcriptional regulator, regulator of autoinduction and epiphytic fitness
MARGSFRQQLLRVREDAIITTVNRLLAEKGFDLMTVDEVAADVGIAKASLYKHFASKEALAAAAMVRVLERGAALLDELAERTDLSAPRPPACGGTRWALEQQLGEMPTLPSQNSTLRAELLGSQRYVDLLMTGQRPPRRMDPAGAGRRRIDPALPPEVVLYTLFARACDPVPGFLKATGQYTDEQIVDMCCAPARRPARPPAPAAAQRISSTGVLQLASTLVATEPITRLVSVPWPCEPIISRSKRPCRPWWRWCRPPIRPWTT